MNPYLSLDSVLGRIANATGALRARSLEATRVERNGGSSTELRERIEKIVTRLEQVADELEAALA